MKSKNIYSQKFEVLTREQLSKVKGGKIIYMMINGKLVPVEVPD